MKKQPIVKIAYQLVLAVLIALILATSFYFILGKATFWKSFLTTALAPFCLMIIILAGEGPESQKLNTKTILLFTLVFGIFINALTFI